jgi:superfamily II DNA helicase RecQ
MVLTATPTDQIIDKIYQTVGFNRQDHNVLYIRKTLDRPNIFLVVKKKKKFEVSALTFLPNIAILQCRS